MQLLPHSFFGITVCMHAGIPATTQQHRTKLSEWARLFKSGWSPRCFRIDRGCSTRIQTELKRKKKKRSNPFPPHLKRDVNNKNDDRYLNSNGQSLLRWWWIEPGWCDIRRFIIALSPVVVQRWQVCCTSNILSNFIISARTRKERT